MHKLLIVNNIPGPYRTFMFQKLHEVGKDYGVDVTVFFQAKGERRRSWKAEDFDMPFPHMYSKSLCRKKEKEFFSYFSLNLDLLREIRKHKYTWVVLAPYMCVGNWLLSVAPMKAKRILWSEGNVQKAVHMGFWSKLLKSTLCKKYAYWATPGIKAIEYLDTIRPGQSAKATQLYLPNIVDSSAFRDHVAELRTRREEIRQELGLVPGTPALFAIGRLVELKGFDQLIRAMAKLERPARLYLAGDGPQEEQLRSLIAELSLEDRVVLLGEQTPEQVQQWLAAADWFVHPARRDCSPLVTVEAANAGVPMILSTQTGNTPEAVEEGVNGFTFDVDDLDSLVGALNEALSLPQDRVDEMGQESLRIAEEKFDPDTVVHDFFKTLLHDKTPNTAPSSPK